MGKGDRRSRKGKVWRHSYGNTRKRKDEKRPAFTPRVKKEKKAPTPKQVEMAAPEAVEATVATTAAEPKAKKAAPAKKKAAEPKAAKEAAPKKKAAAKKK